jgi:hypothetical protein
MGGTTLVVVLVALFLGIIAALAWQEGRRRSFDIEPVYVLDDAVDHVVRLLDPSIFGRVGRSGILQVLEWEVRYLQGGPGVATDRAPVAGGHWEAVTAIVEWLREDGVTFAHEDVAAILAGEADYLVTIGAVGSEVTDGGAES